MVDERVAKGDLSTATEDLLTRGFMDPSPEGEDRPRPSPRLAPPRGERGWGDWKGKEGPLSLPLVVNGVLGAEGSSRVRLPFGDVMVVEAEMLYNKGREVRKRCERGSVNREYFIRFTCELLLGPHEACMDVKPEGEEGEDVAPKGQLHEAGR